VIILDNFSGYRMSLPLLFSIVNDDTEGAFLSLPENVQQQLLHESVSDEDLHRRVKAYMLKK
jgi:hypothetical protein